MKKPKGYPDGNARIVISIPGLSLEDIKEIDSINNIICHPVVFEKTIDNIEVFSNEITNIPFESYCINVPGLPLIDNGYKGVSGPGKPVSELFSPPELELEVFGAHGIYDKWRPYPVSNEKELTNYIKKTALKFAKRRFMIFDHFILFKEWDLILYVEHSVDSIIKCNKKSGIEIANSIIKIILKLTYKIPGVPIILFSPYGVNDNGFAICNRSDLVNGCNWNLIRDIIDGNWNPT